MTQCANSVLMVKPRCFGWNAGTAGSNAMQRAPADDELAAPADAKVSTSARRECEALAQALGEQGVRVILVEQSPESIAPDAVFPNNWLSFHADGTLVLYPMLAPSRRLERDEAVIDAACAGSGFEVRRRIDLSLHEQAGRYLEGTGSLVLDHVARIAYATRSPRTDAALVEEWCRQMRYQPCLFDASDAEGRPWYHTNVMMWIGSRAAAVCAESIAPASRARVMATLESSGRQLLEISRDQVLAFAGNMLELQGVRPLQGESARHGRRSLLVMSASARAALDAAQLARLAGAVDAMVVVPVPTIERVGGGSVRCMLAEIPAVSGP